MQDRFKFRAFITCHICIGVEEEKEISFYIYDVAVYSNGDIGFSRDALLNALSKLDLTENQKDEIEEEISENSYCDDYEWYSIEFGKTEQCTGLKDKNGKLIYEGDIVRARNPSKTIYDKLTVTYEIFSSAFMMSNGDKLKNYLGVFFAKDWCWDIEVISNIHETPKLLENR